MRSASDADKEIPVIDNVVDIIRESEPLEGEGMRLSSNWFNALVRPELMPAYDADLRKYNLDIVGTNAKFATLKNRTPQYFEDDISLITDKWDFETLSRPFDNFVGAWFALKAIADRSKATFEDTTRLMAPHRAMFEKALVAYHDWSYNSKEALLNRRKELSKIATSR
jgi:hypothetical protein